MHALVNVLDECLAPMVQESASNLAIQVPVEFHVVIDAASCLLLSPRNQRPGIDFVIDGDHLVDETLGARFV